MSMNRRQALGQIIKLTGAAAGGMAVSSNVFAEETTMTPWDGTPLEYVKLDPASVANKAFNAGKGCMNEVFTSIVESLAETAGTDQEKWANIPTAMARYGWAGILGEGSTCGNINATGMLFNMVKVPGFNEDKAVTGLMTYVCRFYEQTSLPSNDETFLKAALGDEYTETWFAENVVESTTAESLMCHASITTWAKHNGKVMSEKGPRCTLLSANMAYYITTLLNQALAGELDTAELTQPTAETTACKSCHSTSFRPAMVKTNQACETCHGSH
ncbi:cytochrome C [Ferrimonas lipolytica]|uniref:Cytochrome C n=1 Tax=Ferrimonas lipolytica TaxID=2724191 RepID=A0A6H1UIZ4_9GAMM|nr:cytochrome C [Ferrimonas lipolytica]QIZ78599.1 cytochrome C [Ferrimonas lipolytica]